MQMRRQRRWFPIVTLVCEYLMLRAPTYEINSNNELRLAPASSFNFYSIISGCIRHWSTHSALWRVGVCASDILWRSAWPRLWRKSCWSLSLLWWIATCSSCIDRWWSAHHLRRWCAGISWSWRHGWTCRPIPHGTWRVACSIAGRALACAWMLRIHYGIEATC